MRILKIEQKFQNEETLNEVLEEIKEDIEKIDYCADLMIKGVLANNPEEVSRTLIEVTGAYSNLRTVLSIAQSEKKNREVRYYNSKRIDTENEGKKFVSAPTEKEASTHVAEYRRIRNIIEAYKESAEKIITTCQSILKDIRKEQNTYPQE